MSVAPIWLKADEVRAGCVDAAFWRDPAAVLDATGVRIKSSAYHRETWRLSADSGAVLVKQFRCTTWRERIKWRLGATAAQKEWKLLSLMRARGVPVPVPIAFGSCGDASGRTVWMVLEFIADAVTFDRVNPPKDNFAARRAARGLAQAVATMHVADVCHRDLHSGNLLFMPAAGAWCITDFQRAKAGTLARTDMVEDLVQLQHCMGKKVPMGVRVAFLKEYLRQFARLTNTEDEATGRECRMLFDDIRTKSRAYLVQQARTRSRRCMRSTRDVAPLAAWCAPAAPPAMVVRGWLCRGLSRQMMDDLLLMLRKDTWHLEPDVTLIKNTRAVSAGVWSHPHGRLFIRHERTGESLLGKIRRRLHRTALDRVWRAAWRLRYLHVPVPRPVLAMWTDRGEFLIEVALGDVSSLEAALRGETAVRDPRERMKLLRAVATEIGHLHDCGVVHGNLKTTNIHVAATPAGIRIVFTGNEAVKFRTSLSASDRAADLARLHSLAFPFVNGAERRRFLRLYLKMQSQPVNPRLLMLSFLELTRQRL